MGFLGGGVLPPPPTFGGAELLEAPNKMSGLNQLAPKVPEKIFDRPKAQRNIWPNILRGGGSRGGGGMLPPPPPPSPVVPSC